MPAYAAVVYDAGFVNQGGAGGYTGSVVAMYGPALMVDSGFEHQTDASSGAEDASTKEWEGGSIALYAAAPLDSGLEALPDASVTPEDSGARELEGGAVTLYASVPRDSGLEERFDSGGAVPAYGTPVGPVEHLDGGAVALYGAPVFVDAG
jgi:hypothetical protein